MGNDITLLQASLCGSTVVNDFGNIDALHCSEVNFLALFLLCVNVIVHVGSLNANHGALHVSELLQVVYHLIHNSSGNSEAIADVRARLRVDHRVDADELATSVDQGAARVTLIDGCVSLDHRLHALSHSACLS